MMDIILRILSTAGTVIITGLVIAWIHKQAGSAQPAYLEGQEGIISPGKGTAWFTIIGGSLFMIGGVAFTVFGGALAIILGFLITLMGAAMAGFMAPSLTSIHDLSWNAQGVEGTSKMFGPTLGRQRTLINWSDIVKTGSTITGYWYIESNDGRKIYWSYLYNGHSKFAQKLTRKCPHISMPNQ